MKTVLLIDAFAVIFRAFHGLPDFTAPDGSHVNAVYGFFSTFLKAVRELHPDYVVVGFDSPWPTLRHKEFEDYKAQRPEPPPSLSEQFPLVEELVKSMGIPLLIHEGYEAEDLLATVIAKTDKENLQYIIVTGDRDTLQLANDKVKIYFLRRGLADTELVDGRKVVEMFGVTPHQVIDVKALAGDASDNIPGIRGIGEKTAVALVQQFGGVEGIYQSIDRLPARPGRLLEGAKQQALANKLLVTIRRDAPIAVDLKNFSWQDERLQRALPLLTRFHMKSLIKRVAAPPETPPAKEAPKRPTQEPLL